MNGSLYSSLFVNNNGNVSFGSGMSMFAPGAFSPNTFSFDSLTFLAPYFGDVDTTNANTFQLLLVDRSETGTGNFDFYYNYGSLLWDHTQYGNARAGYNIAGAAADFEFAGSGVAGSMLDSGANALIKGSNVGVNGRYGFTVRGAAITQGIEAPVPASQVPLPGTVGLLGIGALALGFTRRRKA
ncbi:PEP-CTERM sorting domain-containing protein [Pseudoduganella sp. OTU4001]|uniref:PEP-CTERM sorting domain-containing protein n=1 Tax=Pseudoduganella sp. OTU4001 TaxID=3043854 RepID=UPI00313EDE0F